MPAPSSTQGGPRDPVVLGAILRPHGLRGELSIRLFNPESDLLFPGKQVWVSPPAGGARWMEVVEARSKLLKLKGLSSRTDAEALHGAELIVDRSELPEIDPDEVYVHDLIGCRVLDAKGTDLGTFRGIQVSGRQEYFVVDGAREVLLPAEAPVIAAVDEANRTVRLAVEVDAEGEAVAPADSEPEAETQE